MRLLGLVVVAAACGPRKPPEPLVNETPVAAPDPASRLVVKAIALPRPTLAADPAALVPDPTEEARWPLHATAHPAFEPGFDIAGALAQPGIRWDELCRMGAQHRHLSGAHDLESYLRAWCTALHDPAGAVVQLAAITHPTVSGLGEQIRRDIADILVEHGEADRAEHVLNVNKIEDVEVFDMLAASYFEVGRTADAAEINERAIDRGRNGSEMRQCHRLARRVILKPPQARAMYLKDLDALGDTTRRTTQKFPTDPECARLDDEVACWVSPSDRCRGYLAAQNTPDLERTLEVLGAYFTWPEQPARFVAWRQLASYLREGDTATPLAPNREEAVLLTDALTGMTATVECSDEQGLIEIQIWASRLRRQPGHDNALDPRLDAMIATSTEMAKTTKSCVPSATPR